MCTYELEFIHMLEKRISLSHKSYYLSYVTIYFFSAGILTLTFNFMHNYVSELCLLLLI